LEQMRRQRLDPLRLDARDHAGVEFSGLQQLRSHDPVRLLPPQSAARMNPEAPLARAQVVAILALLTDLAEQAGKDRLVPCRIAPTARRRVTPFRLLAAQRIGARTLGGRRLDGRVPDRPAAG